MTGPWIGFWGAAELLARGLVRPVGVALLGLALGWWLAGCGEAPLQQQSDAGATLDAGEPDLSPVGSSCNAEGQVTCLQGQAFACWHTEWDGLLRLAGLGACAALPFPVGTPCDGVQPLGCAAGVAVSCIVYPSTATERRWTRLDPYWFRCSW